MLCDCIVIGLSPTQVLLFHVLRFKAIGLWIKSEIFAGNLYEWMLLWNCVFSSELSIENECYAKGVKALTQSSRSEPSFAKVL